MTNNFVRQPELKNSPLSTQGTHFPTSFKEKTHKVSIILVNFNSGNHLPECFTSLKNLEYLDFEIILVDNGSTDGSVEEVLNNFSDIKILCSEENLGFSSASNIGAQYASGEILAFLNPDTVVSPGWLNELLLALNDPFCGLVTPQILLLANPGRINTCGNLVHFTGMPSCNGFMKKKGEMEKIELVSSVSGAAFIIKKEVFEKIGGFDDSFFLYAEDTDLSWRAKLAGYKSVYMPKSIIYHHYNQHFNPAKYYHLERNRYQILLKCFRWKTLFILLPSLITTEIITWAYALLSGREFIKSKLEGYLWLVRKLPDILSARHKIQDYRITPDRTILLESTYRLSFDLPADGFISKLAASLFNPIYYLLYKSTLFFVRW
jgi:GT2 family glycosyltransferase